MENELTIKLIVAHERQSIRMIKERFRKEKISIQSLGRQRFWMGLIAGVVSAITISLAFNYFREVFRFLTSLSNDLLILPNEELRFYNFFFSTLSSTLGLSVSIWIWMSNPGHKRRMDRIYKQLSQTYALLVFWVILMVVVRFGYILPILVFRYAVYDNPLKLYEEFWLLFVLMPLVVFFQNWLTVRLVYRAGKWMIISFVVCLLFACLLNCTTTVNQEKVNDAYHQRYKKDYQYIDREISAAENNYDIDFKPETIDVLKRWHTERSIEQVMSLKAAFSRNIPVSMDTIILQKITIRNFKQGEWHFRLRNSIENWNYAYPADVLKQIELTGPDENKTRELFRLLKEQIDLINTPQIEWDEYENYTETEIRRSYGARFDIPGPLIRQLTEVRDSLMKVDAFEKYAKELPEMKNDRIK